MGVKVDKRAAVYRQEDGRWGRGEASELFSHLIDAEVLAVMRSLSDEREFLRIVGLSRDDANPAYAWVKQEVTQGRAVWCVNALQRGERTKTLCGDETAREALRRVQKSVASGKTSAKTFMYWLMSPMGYVTVFVLMLLGLAVGSIIR